MNKLYISIGLALVVGLALFGIYRMGYVAGRDSANVAIQQKNIKDTNNAIKNSDEVDKQVQGLGHDDVDRALTDHGWMRPDND